MAGGTPLWSKQLASAAALTIAVGIVAALVITDRSQLTTQDAFVPQPFPLRPIPLEQEQVSARMARYVRLIPPQQRWFAETLDRTGCTESEGPLPVLQSVHESGPRVSVHWRDWHTVEKVRVEVEADALPSKRMEFYPTKPACEDAAASKRRLGDPTSG
jgi:hypothetical protein